MFYVALPWSRNHSTLSMELPEPVQFVCFTCQGSPQTGKGVEGAAGAGVILQGSLHR